MGFHDGLQTIALLRFVSEFRPEPADCAFRTLGRREANGTAKPALKVLELIGATTIVTLPIQVRDVA